MRLNFRAESWHVLLSNFCPHLSVKYGIISRLSRQVPIPVAIIVMTFLTLTLISFFSLYINNRKYWQKKSFLEVFYSLDLYFKILLVLRFILAVFINEAVDDITLSLKADRGVVMKLILMVDFVYWLFIPRVLSLKKEDLFMRSVIYTAIEILFIPLFVSVLDLFWKNALR